MAWVNVTREKRKFCVIILSLSLALILLNSAFSAARGFDMDAFLSGSLISDFAVADYSIFVVGWDRNTSGVPADFLREAEIRGVSEISNIYYHDESAAQVYGVGKQELRHFSEIGFDKLSSGNFAIVSRQVISMGDSSPSIPKIGDTLTLTNANGAPRDFEIIELIDSYPHHLSARFRTVNTLDVIIADNVFLDFFGEVLPMQTNINVDAGSISAFETWLTDYISTHNPNLGFISRNTLQSEFDGLATTYLVLGGSLSFILALVGILNFINAIAASIIARRRELAMLQSVGMTGKQLRQTLFFEGCLFAVFSLCFTLTLGAALGLLFVQIIAGQVWFFNQSFTVMPSVISAIPLVLICVIVPLVCYKRLARESLVEQLRVV
jgi:putative ABC transport system permease protein